MRTIQYIYRVGLIGFFLLGGLGAITNTTTTGDTPSAVWSASNAIANAFQGALIGMIVGLVIGVVVARRTTVDTEVS